MNTVIDKKKEKFLAINIKRVVICLVVMSSLINVYAPYQLDSTIDIGHFYNVLKILIYANTIIVLSYIFFYKRKFSLSGVFAALSPLMYNLYNHIHTYSSNSLKDFPFFGLALSASFLLLDNDEQANVFEFFKKAIAIISLVGIICFLSYNLHLPIPYKVVPYYFGTSRYINYGMSYVVVNSIGSTSRLCGIFNEPGLLGTLNALILCIEDLNFKKKDNVVILIAGLMSFSLAFIIILLVYAVFKYIKDVRTVSLIFVLLFTYFVILPNVKTGNVNIDKLLSRIAITEKGLAGDNRTTAAFDLEYKKFLFGNNIWNGMGYGYVNATISEGVLSIKSYLIDYGVVGFTVVFGYLLFSAVIQCKNNINCIYLVICFFLSAYQRPHIFNLSYLIVLFGGIQYLQSRNKENLNCKEIQNTKKCEQELL